MYKEMNDRMKWCINIKYIVVLNDKTYVFELNMTYYMHNNLRLCCSYYIRT